MSIIRLRTSFLIVTLWFSTLSLPAQQKQNQVFRTYIEQYKDLAIEQMLRYHIPASITLAQGLLESGAGKSELATKGNNHFGIKCHGWEGAKVYHDDDATQECFRAYSTARESFEDHSKFLSTSTRYRQLFSLKETDYKGWAHGLKACGYATNPQYADRLIGIIELYGLSQFDTAKTYDHWMAAEIGKEQTSATNLHPIKIYNKNYYLIARQGDTFKSIAAEVEIPAGKLARHNERKKNDFLAPGDIIYLKAKQSKAIKAFKNKPHTVKAGESLYSIAQMYGIKLKSLIKKNNLDANYHIRPGDKLIVY